MATFTVTTAADASFDGDTIRFASAIEGQRLVLTGGQLTITDDVRIDGDRDDNGSAVTIDAGGNSRVRRYEAEALATLSRRAWRTSPSPTGMFPRVMKVGEAPARTLRQP